MIPIKWSLRLYYSRSWLRLQDRIKRTKSDLEIAGNMAQQQQTTETQAEQQLRDEQDKLSAIEGQLDELVRTMGSTAQNSGRNWP